MCNIHIHIDIDIHIFIYKKLSGRRNRFKVLDTMK